MRIVTGRPEAKQIYDWCAERKVAMVAACCESTGEIEGMLMAAQEFAERNRLREIPVNIGFTGSYPENAQLRKVSTTGRISDDGGVTGGDVAQGFDIMMGLLHTYARLGGWFDRVVVLPFLDHGQPDGVPNDLSILENQGRLAQLAVVMYDCMYKPFEENMERTAKYVERHGDTVMIEGAVDRIYEQQEATTLAITKEKMLTTPERARLYIERTGVDFIVPNLGTEHRVTSEKDYVKKYEKERARQITRALGRVQVLHGTSCLGREINTLAADGMIKVNVYTRIAVESGLKIYGELQRLEEPLVARRNLALNCPTFRNEVHRLEVARIMTQYFEAFDYANLAT